MLAHRTAFNEPINTLVYAVPHKANYTISPRKFVVIFLCPHMKVGAFYMKMPNGYGSVYKLSGNRRKPWAARVTDGWETF